MTVSTSNTHTALQNREGASEDKGAITTFFARRPARAEDGEDEQESRQRGRRRLRQLGGSDGSESESSDAEGGGADPESSDNDDVDDDGAKPQDSDEEGESSGVVQRGAPAPQRSKRSRLVDSEEEEEDDQLPRASKAPAAMVSKCASDNAEEFVYRPSDRANVYTAV